VDNAEGVARGVMKGFEVRNCYDAATQHRRMASRQEGGKH